MNKPLLTCLVLCMTFACLNAATPKPMEDVNTDKLTEELQKSTSAERFELVWWIPQEFWKATLLQSPELTPDQAQPLLDTLEPYAMLAVVQADISPFGAFDFYSEQTVINNTSVTYVDAEGNERMLEPLTQVPADVALLQQQITPMLKAAMGQMGSNFWFFTYKVIDEDGNRIASPYENGRLVVTTTDRQQQNELHPTFQFPLDSLHVPRKCPNGRDAHISWKFCPWTGEKLPE